jgi:post-segregation antitoxin (ccd killing protein)
MDMPQQETIQRETTSIKVKPDLWKEAKKEAINNDITVSELVEDAIDRWIKEHRRK